VYRCETFSNRAFLCGVIRKAVPGSPEWTNLPTFSRKESLGKSLLGLTCSPSLLAPILGFPLENEGNQLQHGELTFPCCTGSIPVILPVMLWSDRPILQYLLLWILASSLWFGYEIPPQKARVLKVWFLAGGSSHWSDLLMRSLT
jgi:hypothetical protein